jgi:hypothetical protein
MRTVRKSLMVAARPAEVEADEMWGCTNIQRDPIGAILGRRSTFF